MCDIYSWAVVAVAWGCSFYIDQKGNVLLRTDRWKSGTQTYFCVFLYLRFVFASISIYLLCKKWRKTGTQTFAYFSYFVFAHICCISIFVFILIRTKTHRPAGICSLGLKQKGMDVFPFLPCEIHSSENHMKMWS